MSKGFWTGQGKCIFQGSRNRYTVSGNKSHYLPNLEHSPKTLDICQMGYIDANSYFQSYVFWQCSKLILIGRRGGIEPKGNTTECGIGFALNSIQHENISLKYQSWIILSLLETNKSLFDLFDTILVKIK